MSCQVLKGTFVNTASTPKFIPIVAGISEFSLRNLTRQGVTALGVSGSLTSDRIVGAYFNPSYMTTGTALIEQNGTVAGILAPKQTGLCAINGCILVNGAAYVAGANKTINSFVPGATTVFTCSGAHGFLVGDVVRIGSMTSAPQLGGLLMTVTAVAGGGTTFTTLLDSTTALTSVGTVYKVWSAGMPASGLYYPQYRAIASVSLANPMVVKTLVQQNYAVGDVVTFNIPTVYGAQQLMNKTTGLPYQATISAVNNAVGTQSVTFANVDSSAFTAFAYAAAASFPYGLATMVPQGEGNLNALSGVTPSPLPYGNQNVLSFAQQNLGANGIVVGAGDGTNSATTGGIIGSTVDAWEWTVVTASQTYY